MVKEKCCGTCRYEGFIEINDRGGWGCHNSDSEYFTKWTFDDDSCEEWEEKE